MLAIGTSICGIPVAMLLNAFASVLSSSGNQTAEEMEEAYEVIVPIMEAQSVEMTAEEVAELQTAISPEMQIAQLKEELARYDYIGTKLAMGVATREEYAEEIAHTEKLRQQIRVLEGEVE